MLHNNYVSFLHKILLCILLSLPISLHCYVYVHSLDNILSCFYDLRGLFDKFVENVYKIVSIHMILIVFANNTGQYVYDRYCLIKYVHP